MDAVTRVPPPINEPIKQYQPGSADRAALGAKIKELAGQRAELTMTVGGRAVMGSGERVAVVQPHNFRHVLGELGNATDADVAAAIAAVTSASVALARSPSTCRKLCGWTTATRSPEPITDLPPMVMARSARWPASSLILALSASRSELPG